LSCCSCWFLQLGTKGLEKWKNLADRVVLQAFTRQTATECMTLPVDAEHQFGKRDSKRADWQKPEGGDCWYCLFSVVSGHQADSVKDVSSLPFDDAADLLADAAQHHRPLRRRLRQPWPSDEVFADPPSMAKAELIVPAERCAAPLPAELPDRARCPDPFQHHSSRFRRTAGPCHGRASVLLRRSEKWAQIPN
jgi:hypothetical protein